MRGDLPVQTVFSMNYDMGTPFKVYASVQDHGSYRAAIDISNGRENLKPMAWESAPGGEYTQHAIDPRDPNIVYSGKLTRTDYSVPAAPRGGGAGRAGGAETPAGPQRDKNIRPPVAAGEDPLRMQVLAPIQISPHDPNTIYFGAQSLYRSRDRGDTWEKVSADMSYNDKTRSVTFRTSSSSRSPSRRKRRGSSIPAPTMDGCGPRWTMARSSLS
jgi:hypothetical protein